MADRFKKNTLPDNTFAMSRLAAALLRARAVPGTNGAEADEVGQVGHEGPHPSLGNPAVAIAARRAGGLDGAAAVLGARLDVAGARELHAGQSATAPPSPRCLRCREDVAGMEGRPDAAGDDDGASRSKAPVPTTSPDDELDRD